jgi:hypothetical protein
MNQIFFATVIGRMPQCGHAIAIPDAGDGRPVC